MPRWTMVVKQRGGCDYTIGCGVQLVNLGIWADATEARAAGEAWLTKSGLLDSDYRHIDGAELYQDVDGGWIDVDRLRDESRRRDQERAAAAALAAERALYKRLQKKFG